MDGDDKVIVFSKINSQCDRLQVDLSEHEEAKPEHSVASPTVAVRSVQPPSCRLISFERPYLISCSRPTVIDAWVILVLSSYVLPKNV